MNALNRTGRVTIELSNRCDMALFHTKCPLHGHKPPIFLPLKTVKNIVKWLGKNDYGKFIAFHNYNESLQDPRLFYLLDYTKNKCKNASIFILTNGHWLDKTILNELELFGVKKVYVSAYSYHDYDRLSKLKSSKLKYRVRKIVDLDDRLNEYNCSDKPRNVQCYAPLGEVVIRCTGDVVLCCRDWDNKHIFGNVIKEDLENILLKKEMRDAYKKLSSGDRYFDLCRACYMDGRYKEKL